MQQEELKVKEVKPISTCIIHGQPLIKFCESCEDVICEECSTKQPHSGMLHRVDSIENAFSRRVEFLKQYIQTQVNPKREAIMNHIGTIHARIGEIEQASRIIGKDLTVEMKAVEGRLEEAQGSRILRIQAEIKRLSLFVNTIDDLFYSFEESVKVPQKFLLMYREFNRNINMIAAYGVSGALPFNLDLPCEIASMEDRQNTLQQFKDKSEFINEIMYSIVSSEKDYVKAKKKEILDAKNKLLLGFYKIEESMLQKNCQLLKICYYCSIPLTIKTINTACLTNKSTKVERQGCTVDKPDVSYNGNKRHFWAEPNLQNRSKQQFRNFSGINSETTYINSIRKLRFSLAQLNYYIASNDTTLHEIFGVKSPETHISKLKFVYVLTHTAKLDQAETDVLAGLLQSEKGIEFGRLQLALNDRDYFENTFKTELENEREKRSSFAPKSRSKYY